MPGIKTDCFAFMQKCKKCSVLTDTVCKKRECTFYKTQEQYDSDRKKYDEIAAAKIKL